MQLMCGQKLVWSEVDRQYGIDSPGVLFTGNGTACTNWWPTGWSRATVKGVNVTEAGRLFVRNIAMVFDAYLPEKY